MIFENAIIKSARIHQKLQFISFATLCKSIVTSGLILFFFYAIVSVTQPSDLSYKLEWKASPNPITAPTNVSHLVFGVVGSVNTWKHKRPYIETWWLPNVTRGYLFLEKAPSGELMPWPSSSPPFRVNELARPNQVRIVHSILDTLKQGDTDVRWIVMTDDDTVLFLDNLVDVLNKYDHTEYYYIGSSSEAVKINCDFSFDMAFGGAGYALSYPLAQALLTTLDGCIQRYEHYLFSDLLLFSCLSDLGVSLTHEKGFHQIDLHSDISGFLSAHLPIPVISLHHFDMIDPIFPTMSRSQSINHLMKAAKADRSRLLQQTICHHRQSNWSFSISWGYSAHVYESILPRSILRRPLETFTPWFFDAGPYFYMFSWRKLTNDPCLDPHTFFFQSIESNGENHTLTTYARRSPRNMPPCAATGYHSADPVTEIHVLSPAKSHKEAGKLECCDVAFKSGMNVADVQFRACQKDEVIA